MAETIRIGLDVAPMHYPPSGVRAYVEALIEAYRNRDSGIDVCPLASPGGLLRGSNRLTRLAWDMHGVAKFASLNKVDLLHMTRFAAPPAPGRPLVVTVHDLIPLQLPEYRSSLTSRVQSELARRTVACATRIIVPSRFVAGEVERELEIDRERIDVIPMGVALPELAETQPPISGPYLIHTGGFDARKNLPMLLRAFARAAAALGPDWRLVLVGAPHTANPKVYPAIWPLVVELGLGDRVILTGRVSDREKHVLYRHASMAVAPSLSEGFGLPILEAMAHGIPVIASDRTSHPEVAGDAAMLVEPTVDALADGLMRLAANTLLREGLVARGRIRTAQFTWRRTADLTAAAYHKAIAFDA